MKLQPADIKRLLPTSYLNRDLEQEIERYFDSEEVLVIYGARQVGKSSMILHLAQNWLKKMPVHYYNLDEIDNFDLTHPDRLVAALQADLTNQPRTIIILDEAQRLPNIGLFIKQIYDQKLPLKIILTGSASFAIKSHISEPLTGRKFEFHLTPFSLAEIFRYQGLSPETHHQPTQQLKQILRDYMIYGGYPKVFFTTSHELKAKRLAEIVNSYISRDLVDLFQIIDVTAVKKVTSYVADNIGNLLSIEKITSLGGLKRELVISILEALEQTFVSLALPPLSTSKFNEIAKRPKLYFHDVGLRNAFLAKTDERLLTNDWGALFENTIAIQLAKYLVSNQLFYWRTINQTEVDFVIQHPERGWLGVETKYRWNSENLPRALTSFMNNYQAQGVMLDTNCYWRFLDLV